MFKLVKYDLKAYYKDFIIMVCAMVLLNLALCFKINSWGTDVVFGISMIISFVAAVVVVIWNIAVFARDIYGDSGYLLFTTPQSGYSILGSKIITAIIQCIVIAVVAFLVMLVWTQVLNFTSSDTFHPINGKYDMADAIYIIIKNINPMFIVSVILEIVVLYITFLLTIYFSITLSKVAIKNRKFGKLGSFVIFIILVVAQARIETFIVKVFPQTFKLNVAASNANSDFINPLRYIDVNISLVVCSIAIMAAMFCAISYLLENKMDL